MKLLMILVLASVVSAGPTIRRYGAIFSFGDSHADTGNGIPIYAERSFFNPSAGPPYGMEFFGHPTGRNSNGRLIIDFIAEDLGLPFVPPSLVHNGSFCHGANFAVAGAFARNASFYSDLPIVGPFALNTSSSVQLQWFDSLKPSLSLCSSREQGFNDILRCCCGGGGKYNFNMSAGCGMPGSMVCEDPSTHLYWDGHFTEAANRHIANGWLYSIKKGNV